jgi:hypothetical protein
MRCIHCGKDISILANVCPYCDRDTEATKENWGREALWAVLATGGGFLAGSVFGVGVGIVTFFGVCVAGAFTAPAVKTPPRSVQVVQPERTDPTF